MDKLEKQLGKNTLSIVLPSPGGAPNSKVQGLKSVGTNSVL